MPRLVRRQASVGRSMDGHQRHLPRRSAWHAHDVQHAAVGVLHRRAGAAPVHPQMIVMTPWCHATVSQWRAEPSDGVSGPSPQPSSPTDITFAVQRSSLPAIPYDAGTAALLIRSESRVSREAARGCLEAWKTWRPRRVAPVGTAGMTTMRGPCASCSGSWPRRRNDGRRSQPTLRFGQIQLAALHHPDPFLRRGCLGFLDHYANEASASVFALALRDPVELVRHAALHSFVCETCRTEELCVADVVPHLVEVLFADPSPELRHKAIPVLLRLADRDPRARQVVEQTADDDRDVLVREVARRALAGQHVRSRTAYQRRARRRRTPA